MRRNSILLLVIILFNVLNVIAQDSAMDKVTKETCEYFNNNLQDIKSSSKTERLSKLGLKILEIYQKNKKALNAEGIVVDLGDQNSIGKFGEMVGMRMALECPDAIMVLMEDFSDEDIMSDEPETQDAFEGSIKKISGEELLVIEVKDTQGKTQKVVWLTNFEGSDELLDLDKKALKKKVKVYYSNMEFFSPKLKEYVIRKKITKLEFLD